MLAQRLRTLTAFSEDLSLTSSTHIRWLTSTCNPNSFGPYWQLHIHGMFIDTHIGGKVFFKMSTLQSRTVYHEKTMTCMSLGPTYLKSTDDTSKHHYSLKYSEKMIKSKRATQLTLYAFKPTTTAFLGSNHTLQKKGGVGYQKPPDFSHSFPCLLSSFLFLTVTELFLSL